MSLKETLFGLIDNVSLPSLFARKLISTRQLRKPLLAGIERTRQQFEQGAKTAPHRWWKLKNDVVALTVKVKGTTFDINGVATNHIPASRFLDFLDKFRDAVEAGEFDEELRHDGEGDARVRIPRPRKSRASKSTPAIAPLPDGAVSTPVASDPPATGTVGSVKPVVAGSTAARARSKAPSAAKPKASKATTSKPAPRRKRATSSAKRAAPAATATD